VDNVILYPVDHSPSVNFDNLEWQLFIYNPMDLGNDYQGPNLTYFIQKEINFLFVIKLSQEQKGRTERGRV